MPEKAGCRGRPRKVVVPQSSESTSSGNEQPRTSKPVGCPNKIIPERMGASSEFVSNEAPT